MTREDILRSLRIEFCENTRMRLVEMTSLLESLVAVPDQRQLRELGRNFHGLAGLGGTYGYQSITSLSREGEDTCEAGFGAPQAVDYPRLRTIVQLLAEAIDEGPDSE